MATRSDLLARVDATRGARAGRKQERPANACSYMSQQTQPPTAADWRTLSFQIIIARCWRHSRNNSDLLARCGGLEPQAWNRSGLESLGTHTLPHCQSGGRPSQQVQDRSQGLPSRSPARSPRLSHRSPCTPRARARLLSCCGRLRRIGHHLGLKLIGVRAEV